MHHDRQRSQTTKKELDRTGQNLNLTDAKSKAEPLIRLSVKHDPMNEILIRT
jgi:hypothetical protein